MIKKLSFILLLMLSISITAQTNTINIDWSFGSNSNSSGNTNANRTVEVGDTVTWNWYSNGTHNVSSKGTSNESFKSALLSNGASFSHTFTSIGTNDYQCDPHSGSMFGTITVVSEGTLNIDSFNILEVVKMYPNPTDSKITIDFNIENIEKLNVKIFNLLGKEVLKKQLSKKDTSLLLSSLTNGIYVVRITSIDGKNSITKRLVKI